MLTPDYLDSCLDYLLGMYDALNTAITEDIARRIVKTGKVTDSAAWQAKQIQENGKLMNEVVEDVARITGKTSEEIQRLFNEAAVQGMKFDADPLLKAGYDVNLELSPAMSQTLEAAITKTKGDMRNLTMTTGSTASGIYLDATNLAYTKVQSGGFSYYEAIRQAIRAAAVDGSYVLYGNNHRTQLDVAIRRSVLTGVNQTAGKLTEQYSEDMGAEYYETTAHHGARPSHSVWQGRVFKIHGSTAEYPNFVDSTGYGTGAGLCGWNCRHSFFPYWPGISKPAYTPSMLKNYDAKKYTYNGEKLSDYECSQIQRAYERKIREYKRILASYDAGIKASMSDAERKFLKEEFDKESVNLKAAEREMMDFCRKTNRSVDNARTQVVAYKDANGRIVNFGRSTAQKAVWSNKKNK